MKRSNNIMRHLYSRWCLLFWIVLASVQLEKIKMPKLIMIGFWLWQTGKIKITKFLAKNGCTIQKMYWLCWKSSMSKWYAIQKIFKNVLYPMWYSTLLYTYHDVRIFEIVEWFKIWKIKFFKKETCFFHKTENLYVLCFKYYIFRSYFFLLEVSFEDINSQQVNYHSVFQKVMVDPISNSIKYQRNHVLLQKFMGKQNITCKVRGII